MLRLQPLILQPDLLAPVCTEKGLGCRRLGIAKGVARGRESLTYPLRPLYPRMRTIPVRLALASQKLESQCGGLNLSFTAKGPRVAAEIGSPNEEDLSPHCSRICNDRGSRTRPGRMRRLTGESHSDFGGIGGWRLRYFQRAHEDTRTSCGEETLEFCPTVSSDRNLRAVFDIRVATYPPRGR